MQKNALTNNISCNKGLGNITKCETEYLVVCMGSRLLACKEFPSKYLKRTFILKRDYVNKWLQPLKVSYILVHSLEVKFKLHLIRFVL